MSRQCMFWDHTNLITSKKNKNQFQTTSQFADYDFLFALKRIVFESNSIYKLPF
jgi:hypothetical protein